MEELSNPRREYLFELLCFMQGGVMLGRGFYYHAERSLGPNSIPLGFFFLATGYAIFLMYKKDKVGFWLFMAMDLAVSLWFIYVIKEPAHHHIIPHILFAIVWIPFYKRLN